MSSAPHTFIVDPKSELGRALDAADETPIILLRDGVRYRVSRDPIDPWSTYDPDRVREALRRVAGTLTPEEGERIKESIYRGREERTRPLNRP